MHIDYPLTIIFHATKSWKQNIRTIIYKYIKNEKKTGLQNTHSPLNMLFWVYNRRIKQRIKLCAGYSECCRWGHIINIKEVTFKFWKTNPECCLPSEERDKQKTTTNIRILYFWMIHWPKESHRQEVWGDKSTQV
jgi:hypothetical protein